MTDEPQAPKEAPETGTAAKRRKPNRYDIAMRIVLGAAVGMLTFTLAASFLPPSVLGPEDGVGKVVDKAMTVYVYVLVAALFAMHQIPTVRRFLQVPNTQDERDTAIGRYAQSRGGLYLSLFLFGMIMCGGLIGDRLEPYLVAQPQPYLVILAVYQGSVMITEWRARRRM